MNPCTNLCRTLNTIPSAQGGTYLVVLWLRSAREATVGRLGTIRFPRGYYTYAGSAKGGLTARLHRHVHGAPTRHWHLDYLRPQAHVLAWYAFAGSHYPECALAQILLPWGHVVCQHFGASDCSCPAHLVYYRHRADVMQALRQLAAPAPNLSARRAGERRADRLTQPTRWYGGVRAGLPLVKIIGESHHALHENARGR
jgi:Uri superfamily endonuclease